MQLKPQDSVSSNSSTQPVQQLLLSRNTTKGCPIIQIHNRLFCPPVVTVHTGQPGHSVTCSLKIALRVCGNNFYALKIALRLCGQNFYALRITPKSARTALYALWITPKSVPHCSLCGQNFPSKQSVKLSINFYR